MHAYRDIDAEPVIREFCAENDRGLAHSNFFNLHQVYIGIFATNVSQPQQQLVSFLKKFHSTSMWNHS